MSDNDKGPLDKRGKGLEDEWIRRHEAEQAEEEKAKRKRKTPGPNGEPGNDDDDSYSDEPVGPPSAVMTFVWVGIVVAIILLIASLF